jgi:hypothetical protein
MESKNSEPKQFNIDQHSKNVFDEMLKRSLIESLHIVASRGHGKSRLMFSIADSIRNLENTRLFIFDGSDAFLYGYSKIAVLNICENDITENELKTTLDLEQYKFNNWQIVKLAIQQNKHLLIRLKTKKQSKRSFAIQSIINFLDDIQRAEKEASPTNETKSHLIFMIDEIQNAFSQRQTARLSSEDFMCCFSEARNFSENFISTSQRLFDVSKTVRTKTLYCIGKLNAEDKSPYIKQIEKQYNINFSNMESRKWFFNGETFTSPTWKQEGKPFLINRELRAKYFNSEPKKEVKPLGMVDFFKFIFSPTYDIRKRINQNNSNQEETEKGDPEESELDLYMSETDHNEDTLFPNQEEEF